MAKIG